MFKRQSLSVLLVAETRSNLGGASLDHHKTYFANITGLHRVGSGGARISSLKLFNIIVGHVSRVMR